MAMQERSVQELILAAAAAVVRSDHAIWIICFLALWETEQQLIHPSPAALQHLLVEVFQQGVQVDITPLTAPGAPPSAGRTLSG